MGQETSHVRLSEYLDQVQRALKAALPGSAWVIAELSSIKISPRGHVYLDLIESDQGREVAKARAIMFAKHANNVLGQWQSTTGGQPQAGMRLLMQVRADFSVQYGFSLQVSAIDPAYTLGDMELRLQQTIAKLQERGWFDLQRQHSTPASYRRVAVIAPHEAAGLADFQRDADRLAQAEVCSFEYFSAVFQGKDASLSLRDALKAAHARHTEDPFDLVCIIRGGGSKADLQWLNCGNLASWVCRFPIPVYTGIGHEIDECVLDLVAHRRFDTPSKVIGHFRSVFQQEAAEIRRHIDQITGGMLRMVASYRSYTEQAGPRFAQGSQNVVNLCHRRIGEAGNTFSRAAGLMVTNGRVRGDQMNNLFASRAQRMITQQLMATQSLHSGFRAGAQALVERQKADLSMAGTLFERTNPLALLERGFAMAQGPDGKGVSSARAAKEAGALQLRFHDGAVCAQVTEET